MASVEQPYIVLNADQEHAGVRYLVLTILLVMFALSFLLLNIILRSLRDSLVSDFALALSCVGGLIFGLAFAALAEHILKRNWPSGRHVTLSGTGANAHLPDGEEIFLDWSKRLWATRWYFSLQGFPKMGREKRVPSSYLCLACQIQQDEVRLIVYSYLPKLRANDFVADGEFHKIFPAEFYKSGPLRRVIRTPDRPQIPSGVLAGKNGLYWMAEKRRWTSGLELTPDDFELFSKEVVGRVEE
jgi:hypothetical protein